MSQIILLNLRFQYLFWFNTVVTKLKLSYVIFITVTSNAAKKLNNNLTNNLTL